MEQENAKPKRKWLYYIILAVCVLLLVAATVLTVYFVTNNGSETLEAPPADDGNEPSGNLPSTGGEEEPGEPSGGEDAVRFVSPVENASYTVEYNVIYVNETLGWIYRHKAIDFDAKAGTEVVCMADGKIESISYCEETGNVVIVDHGDDLKTVYRFVEPDSTLKEGASVKKGQRLGEVAAAYGIEHKDGEHLHLEIQLHGDNVDPTAYLDGEYNEK